MATICTLNLANFNHTFETVVNSIFQDMSDMVTEELYLEERPFILKDPTIPTYRREGMGTTGRIAYTPRDVIDTGELMDSQNIEIKSSVYTGISELTINYDADYAVFIYMGYNQGSGIVQVPYPWIANAIDRMDFPTFFAQYWRINERSQLS
jgi:hypothetical protein